MHAEQWGLTVGEILGKGSTSLAAKWQACCAATATAAQMAPFPECNPDGFTHEKHELLDSLHLHSDIDRIRATATMFGLDFGMWRTHCLDLEAKNAARLQVLVWVLRTLGEVSADPELAPAANAIGEKVLRNIEQQWRILPDSVPTDSTYRAWCTRVTRNYRMLPKIWRYV